MKKNAYSKTGDNYIFLFTTKFEIFLSVVRVIITHNFVADWLETESQ